ncbi:DUF3383 domain-containing protein [Methylobacterium sp. NMS14P]|uniref:DUF3383 domain-containing protein n=1 Tax=Methylobacterium sp. NMS14P TaxID=2894310 RepID=UPI002359DF2E|nr:DUF3383 domain-containing protein [Methylobacterium sp. NMS14P]WCS27235.1 DUF3383 domain-containing protein [Methylobacterium sp. NMS14P]
MAAGLAPGVDISDFVSVSVTISRTAALYRNFGIGLILGSTPGVIDTSERLRFYTGITGVAQDFGTSAPEYLAALAYFSQSPQPGALFIGRWAQAATHGHIRGATLSPMQRLLSVFTAVSNGSLSLSIDGTARNITGINLSSALNLNGVASAIQTAIAAVVPGVTVKWDAVYNRFDIVSPTTGTASSVSYATASGSGTDLGPLMHLTSVDASAPVPGIAPETLVSAAATLANMSTAWYALLLAPASAPLDSDVIAVASFIEGIATSQSRIFGVTTQNANVLDGTQSADLASQLQSLNLARTFIQFSSNNAYAAASLFGRIATVDWEGSNTAITLAYKQQPGIASENIAESQFAALKAKNCNVYIKVNNGTSIVWAGVMTDGDFIDERVIADWFQNRIQVDVYNLMYGTQTKVPQNDAGMTQIGNRIKSSCEIGVTNQSISEGIWLGPPIGPINTGDNLPKGYYVYYPPVATQSDADRAARKSVPYQVLAKLAGAVHLVNVAAILDR